MENKELFQSYLESIRPGKSGEYIPVFERYLELLQEINASINLISRKVPPTGDDNQRLVGLIVMGVAGAGILALLLADRAARKKRDRLG